MALLLQTEIALIFRDPIQQNCTPPAMGCGTSKLKGDSFDSINPSTYPPAPRDKDEIERSQESKPLIYDADIPKTVKEASAAKRSHALPHVSLPIRTSSPRLSSPPSLKQSPQHIPRRLTPTSLGTKPSTTAPIETLHPPPKMERTPRRP